MYNSESALVGISPQQLEKDKREEQSIKHCGEWWYSENPRKPGTLKKFRNKCKRKDCPLCREDREKATAKRLEKIFSSDRGRKIRLTAEEEKQFKKEHGLTKNDYIRQPHDDGNVTLVFEDDELGEPLTYDDIREISREPRESNKRISGNLGKSPAPKKEETEGVFFNDDFDWDAVEEIMSTLVYHIFRLETSLQSTIKNVPMLHNLALLELEIDPPKKYDVDFAQYVIYQIEEKMVEIAKRNNAEIQFLYLETESLVDSEIDWSVIKEIVQKKQGISP